MICLDIKKIQDRLYTLDTSIKQIKTPFFFPAISSVKTNEELLQYYKIIRESGYPGFLVSAYDIHRDKQFQVILNDLARTTESAKVMTLMDSGNYEAFWHKDKHWSDEHFEEILKSTKVDIAFSFDIYCEKDISIKEHTKEIVRSAAKTASVQSYGTTAPIIHGNKDNIAQIVEEVLNNLTPEIIGVTERDLGHSLIERANTIKQIRQAIDKRRTGIPLHVLGTGNPCSILVYSVMGADLFDGLEWCKNIIDPHNGHVFHFVQKDLFECRCKACSEENLPYPRKTMWHNLIFYENFCKEIQSGFEKNEIESVLDKYLPKRTNPKIKKMMGFHE